MSAPKWVPLDYADEFVSHLTDQPSAWLAAVAGGHVLRTYDGEVPEADAPHDLLADGELVLMQRLDRFGDATLTIHDSILVEDDPVFTVSREMPALATEVWIVGEDWTAPSVAELVDELDHEPGETSIRYLRWTEHRFRYRAETGTLEPEDAASLAPLPEEPAAPLPLFGDAP